MISNMVTHNHSFGWIPFIPFLPTTPISWMDYYTVSYATGSSKWNSILPAMSEPIIIQTSRLNIKKSMSSNTIIIYPLFIFNSRKNRNHGTNTKINLKPYSRIKHTSILNTKHLNNNKIYLHTNHISRQYPKSVSPRLKGCKTNKFCKHGTLLH